MLKRSVFSAVILFYLLLLFAGGSHSSDFRFIYEVGPGKNYQTPGQVPWERLQASSLVLIYARQAPYADKWVISTSGTADKPVVVRGVPDDQGNLPVISGDNAATRLELDYWNENRSVIKIGGSSHPAEFPSFITIENLDIRSGRPPYRYTDDNGSSGQYSTNAAAIHVEMGRNITIRNCILQNSANGFFAGSQVSDLLLEGNYLHDNGMEGSIYQHNSYTEVDHITFQYNHFGALRPGCRGNNLKDRSAGTLIRYNWIETGSRTIDLVESDHATLLNDPDYRKTSVYGNVLIKHDVQENGQVVHYGGDGGDYDRYRKGILYFFNNTIISHRSGNTTLFGISSNDEQISAINNIVYLTSGSGRLAVMGSEGRVALSNNWLPTGWKTTHESGLNGSLEQQNTISGTLPGFRDVTNDDYHLAPGSPCIDTADPDHAPDSDIDRVSRPRGKGYDIGAYEYREPSAPGIFLLLNGVIHQPRKQ